MVDDSVKALVDTLKNRTLAFGQQRVGRTPFPLIANDAKGNRIVRQEETNLANFCTDAFRIMLDTDIALINAGGIRENIEEGDITYNDLLRVFPFNNTVCIATLTGKQLVDVLEYSTRYLPKESGGLLHVSGLRYIVIENECPVPIIYDENNLFVALSSKSERLDRIEIWDKQAQRYVPIKMNKEYTIAAFDYHIKKMGGNGILRNAVLKQDKMNMDVDVLSAYLFSLNGCVPAKYAKPEGRMIQAVGTCACQCDEP
jgi:2',3'-cyclic-nucleotide 2'-phosphodiesterase (5'-nucleotidase family)